MSAIEEGVRTAVSIVAHSHPFVVGVDTHARNHVYAIITATTGEVVDTREFPTTSAGINRAIAWVARRTEADLDTLWVIEGAGTYGALLAGAITSGYPVVEAARMDARNGRGVGKSDTLGAQRIAQAVLSLKPEELRRPRLNAGVRQALGILATARDAMTTERTRAVNALTALLRASDLGMDARRALSGVQIAEVSRWRAREEELALSIARSEAIRLAKRITELDADLKSNSTRMTDLVEISEAAPLLKKKSFGPVTAAICLAAWSHRGRIRSCPLLPFSEIERKQMRGEAGTRKPARSRPGVTQLRQQAGGPAGEVGWRGFQCPGG